MKNSKDNLLENLSALDDDMVTQKLKIKKALKLLNEVDKAQDVLINKYSDVFIKSREIINKAE